MDLAAAKRLANDLIARHGLAGWCFRFDHARRRFGSCQYQRKLITLSRPLTLLNSEHQVRDTILHEIAHALTPGDNHGPRWKAACQRIGARPFRCYSDSEVVSPHRKPARYRIGCQRCDWWTDRHRLSARRLVCRACREPIVYEEKLTGRRFRIVVEDRRRLVKRLGDRMLSSLFGR